MKTFKPKAYIATDSYKLGHMVQYPQGTNLVYSNWTPRTTKRSPIPAIYNDGKIVVYGVQATIMEMVALWKETFFSQPWEEVSKDLDRIVAPFVGDAGFEVGIENFKKLHELGYLPLIVKSLPEGSVVSQKVPILTIRNTKLEFFWLTGYLETYLSNQLWKMSTIATIARAFRKIGAKYAELTGAPEEFIDFQFHDFSARGLSGAYDNAMVGSAHLTVFKGTDSLLGTQFLEHFYGAESTFIGGSVPATEHSIMTAKLEEGELETFSRLLDQYPKGIVSIVSDSYDFWKVMTEFTVALQDKILNRQPDSLGMSKVVFRPDSGNPVDIICGEAIPVKNIQEITDNYFSTMEEEVAKFFVVNGVYTKAVKTRGKEYFVLEHRALRGEEITPAMKGAAECLWEVFGGEINSKGYRMLNSSVGLIYGDSITLLRAEQMFDRLARKGFASSNIVLGIGSFSYQMLTRDTFGYAMKSTYQEVNGEGIAIYKDPKTDDGTKKSATGLLRVELEDGEYILYDNQTLEQEAQGELKVLFKDGVFENTTDLETIRVNLLKTL